jgi:hypothetical protein
MGACLRYMHMNFKIQQVRKTKEMAPWSKPPFHARFIAIFIDCSINHFFVYIFRSQILTFTDERLQENLNVSVNPNINFH